MPCAWRSLPLQACALLATGRALAATALRPLLGPRGVLPATAAAFSFWEGIKETDHIHFGSSLATLMCLITFEQEKKKTTKIKTRTEAKEFFYLLTTNTYALIC